MARTRYFSDGDKATLLAAIATCRDAGVKALTAAPPTGDIYKSVAKLNQAIDELAGVLTGDREHFHDKKGAGDNKTFADAADK